MGAEEKLMALEKRASLDAVAVAWNAVWLARSVTRLSESVTRLPRAQ